MLAAPIPVHYCNIRSNIIALIHHMVTVFTVLENKAILYHS